MDLAQCGEIGRSQDGLITRKQALQFLSPRQIDNLLSNSSWMLVHPAVYANGSAPVTWRQPIRAATLARSSAIASHRSAAYMLGLIEKPSKCVDILVPFTKSVRLSDVKVHRTRSWHSQIQTTVDGIPCTSAARTVIDLTRFTSPKRLGHAVDLGITSKVLRLDDIVEELLNIGTQGRSRCSMLFEVLAVRDKTFEKTDHLSEAEWLAAFDVAGLPRPVPQMRIPLGKTLTARPDFAYPELKIAVEIVSWRWHGGPMKFEEDITRRAKLRTAGWLVVEISRKTSISDAVAAIRSAVAERRLLAATS